METIFNHDAPQTLKDFCQPSEKSIRTYHDRVTKRWQEKAPSIKRAYTFYSPFAVLMLITLQAHYI